MAAPHSDLYAAWYDASDAATLTIDGSNLVSQWSDKSGNGRHVTQATAASRPTYNAQAVGVKFGDAANWMQTAANHSVRYGFAALSGTTAASLSTVFSGGSVNALRSESATKYRGVGGSINSDDFTSPDGRTWINGSLTLTHAGNAVPHVVVAESTSLKGTGAISTATSGQQGRYWLHELIFVAAVLTDAQIAAISEYLVGRWTLPAESSGGVSRPVLSSPHLIGDLR